ncbi:hypothetical protein FB459_2590 [Yimella lutea]|uniref:Uncharacterized protein n=1 Tax=Yimella lutea TaxID=587872 RepID=A0A542EIA0_9MICO|nr:hypothetical protein FB459_2590 [Yimella lutea]
MLDWVVERCWGGCWVWGVGTLLGPEETIFGDWYSSFVGCGGWLGLFFLGWQAVRRLH